MFQRPSMPDINTEYLIIGAGVAGLHIGTKLAESGKEVWMLGSPYESQLAKAGEILDTDLPKGTMGLEHMEELLEMAKEKGVKHKSSNVVKISVNDNLLVETKRQKFFPKKIIIATGAKQKKLNFEGETEFFHKGISDCSICDFPLYNDKIVGVLGNHEYTRRAANFLVNKTERVYLFWYQNNDEPEIDERINLIKVNDVIAKGDEILTGVQVTTNNGTQDIELQGLFVEGQPVPATAFLREGEIELDDNGYVIIDDRYQTNISNIYAVGDVTGKTKNYKEILVEINKLASLLK